jgi:hypothetical protein
MWVMAGCIGGVRRKGGWWRLIVMVMEREVIRMVRYDH